jgi:glutamine cyclotransferase
MSYIWKNIVEMEGIDFHFICFVLPLHLACVFRKSQSMIVQISICPLFSNQKMKADKLKIALGLLIILFIITTTSSFTFTKNINISKKKINELKTVYEASKIGKLPIDSKWRFLSKNICQYNESIFPVKNRTYTGTWNEKNDTIYVSFFIRSKSIKESYKFYLDKKNKKLIEIGDDGQSFTHRYDLMINYSR